MEETILRAERVSYRYEDEGPLALNEIDLSVRAGEMTAVLGHNGSGKSTLAKLLNGLYTPTAGKVTVCGMDTALDENTWEIRRSAGMVFQNPDNQLVATIVEDDVAFGPENLGVPMPELRRRVDDALAAVGMSEYANREPHHLSGGQKQRVAIAGIIAMRPECIVFDESTAMLDPLGRREVLDTIRMLNRENGITIINITHYMNEAALADRVIVINDGSILMDGMPDEVFARRNELRAVGLEVPQCAELIYRLREAGIPVRGTGISKVEACADLLTAAFAAEGDHHG